MTTMFAATMTLLVLAGVACGASAVPPAAIATAPAPKDAAPTPIPTTGGVKGTFDGTPFVSKSAVARKTALEGYYLVYVLEDRADCGTFDGTGEGLKEGARFLEAEAEVDWRVGKETNIGGGSNESFFFVRAPGVASLYEHPPRRTPMTGTIEVLEAPTAPGGRAKLRIRATSTSGSVQGETEVAICP